LIRDGSRRVLLCGRQRGPVRSRSAAHRFVDRRALRWVILGGASPWCIDNRLPFEEGSFDTVVTTFVLCTVGDVDRALNEIGRVLKTDGQYLLLEHGLAPDAGVQKWQQRLNRFNRLVFGGCNLNRPIAKLVVGAGFTLQASSEFFQAGAPRFAGWTVSAIATRR
jgi:SAM-dependent methyltransferase